MVMTPQVIAGNHMINRNNLVSLSVAVDQAWYITKYARKDDSSKESSSNRDPNFLVSKQVVLQRVFPDTTVC